MKALALALILLAATARAQAPLPPLERPVMPVPAVTATVDQVGKRQGGGVGLSITLKNAGTKVVRILPIYRHNSSPLVGLPAGSQISAMFVGVDQCRAASLIECPSGPNERWISLNAGESTTLSLVFVPRAYIQGDHLSLLFRLFQEVDGKQDNVLFQVTGIVLP